MTVRGRRARAGVGAARRRARGACSSACSCSARSLAGSRGRPRRSGRWTSPRSPGRGRCTRPTRGCSSPSTIDGRPEPAPSDARRVPGARARRGRARRARQRRGRRATSASPTAPRSRRSASASRAREVVEVRRGGRAARGADRGRGGGRARPRRRGRRGRRRLRRTARLPAGQADAAGRRARLRPHGAGGARGRRDAAGHQRLPVRRRAGGAVRRQSRPEVGRAARDVAAPQRHRARPRAALGLRLAGANAGRFHFIQRYPHEPWHYGYTLNPRSTPRPATGDGGHQGSAMPAFVPSRFAPMLARAAQRWNVSAALLAAQIYAESNFNPFAQSPAGAQGIAQFMPGTAEAMGLDDPFDARRGDRRPGAPDARPAAPLRHRPARPRRLQRRPRSRRGLHVHPALRGDARLRRPHPRRCSAARARSSRAPGSASGSCDDAPINHPCAAGRSAG